MKRRIHATDSRFEPLRKESILMLGRHDVSILSVFQLTQEIPYDHFDEQGIKFDEVYAALLKKLLEQLSLHEYQKVRIIIDARKHKGGELGAKLFRDEIMSHLNKKFPETTCAFKLVPSNMDVLVELADFVSNTFYREYQSENGHTFNSLGFKFVQIKNPL